MADLQYALKKALEVLYHHPDDAFRAEADRWLQNFQRTLDAWQTLLKKFFKGPPKVRTQISIAVAALAVHVSVEDWGGGGIVNWLRDEMNVHHEFVLGFLELLTVLPQEAFNHKIAARPERRRQFEKELRSSVEVALNLLTACLNFNEFKEQACSGLVSPVTFVYDG